MQNQAKTRPQPTVPPRRKLWSMVFEFFQKRCPHDAGWVREDILEGGGDRQTAVRWCLRCGAYRRTFRPSVNSSHTVETEWVVPRATWAERWPL